MNNVVNQNIPQQYSAIQADTISAGFSMASDIMTCSLLKTLAASKPKAHLLELGTGTGLSTTWILAGMDAESSLISVDCDERFLNIAKQYLSEDNRLSLILMDGAEWINRNSNQKFDYIFADTWHGKYLLLDEVLAMLNKGGLYIIDDMSPQPNWPDGHELKAEELIRNLETRQDIYITKQVWATGIVIATKVTD